MKFAAYIVALLLLVLPCIPVKAGVACCPETLQQCTNEESHHDCDDENEKDQHAAACSCCSSYFCGNCNYASINDFSIEIGDTILVVERPAFGLVESKLSTHLSLFWQPPRP